MTWGRRIAFFFFSLFLIGGAGYASFVFMERYQSLRSKAQWLKDQEQILTRGLEDQARRKKELEGEQLDFAGRLADQEKRLKQSGEERTSLLESIRRISQRNRELAQKEEAAEEGRSETASLVRERNEVQERIGLVEASNQKLQSELKEFKGKFSQLEAELRKDYGAKRKTYEKEIEDLRDQLKGLKDQAVQGAALEQERGRLEKELQSLEKERRKERSSYFYNLGVIYTRNGLFRKAEEMYQKALELDPADPQAHYNLAVIYDAHLAETKKAVQHYERFMKLSPDEKARRKVKLWIVEAKERKPGTPRRTAMESSRETIDRLFLTTN